MAEILKSAFLGIIQGLTEFLPVSSSAHLNIFPWLFKWTMSESFDLALHAGTLVAILVYFFKDWLAILKGGYMATFKGQRSTEGRIFWYLIAATIPAGVLGMLMEKGVDKLLGGSLDAEMIVISIALIVMGVLLYLVDLNAKSKITYSKMNFKQGFLIGISQAVAGAIPGVSRSGITMTVARAFGLDRESAAKYSFLLSGPMVAGAVLASIKDFEISAAFFVGIALSFISGLLVIKFLLSYLKKGSYKGFAIYRVVFGLLVFIIAVVRIIF